MCQKVEFAGWARFKPKVTPYSLRDVDTPDHRRLRATSRDKAELAEPGSVPGYIESFTASRREVHHGFMRQDLCVTIYASDGTGTFRNCLLVTAFSGKTE
jgi:hypothetical protein